MKVKGLSGVWMKNFTDRDIKEIDFSIIYADNFNHGTNGHNEKIIIAKMANMLNGIHFAIGGPFPDIDKIKEIMGQKEAKDG